MAAFYCKSCHDARRPALPRLWLLTDERVTDSNLLAAIGRMPRGSGIVFRHYGLQSGARRALFGKVRALARKHGHMVLTAPDTLARPMPYASGVHIASHSPVRRSIGRGLISASAHDMREVARANRLGADLLFLSPVFPTRSHPGGQALGMMRFAALAARANMPVVALGGMNMHRFARLKPLGAYGWAGIDALVSLPSTKRKEVQSPSLVRP